MLTSIRNNFSRGISRVILIILMVLLIASFALFGIQDVVRNFTSREAINIGGHSITAESYARIYRERLQEISQRFGQVITPAVARSLGIDNQIRNAVVAEEALNIRARELGMGLESRKVALSVQQDPEFQDRAGRFDSFRLQQALRAAGNSEASFLAEQGNVYLRRQLSEALAGGADAPKALQEAVNRYSEETRNIAYLALTDAQAGTVPAPEPAALQSYFDEHKSEFRAPEYRKFAYIAALPDELAKKQEVSDADAQSSYEASKAQRYTTPEKRTIQQIPFGNEAEAKAALDRITAGSATFEAIATEKNIKEADLTLGALTRAQVIDPAIAEAAFKLGENQVSDPVKGRISTMLLRVTKVEPQVVQAFDTVKDKVKQEVARQRAARELVDLQKQAEDERTSGTPLREIAPKLGLKVVEVGPVTAAGLDDKGAETALPQKDRLLQSVFQADTGGDFSTLESKTDGIVWYSLDTITPARDQTLDETRAAVIAAWTAAERARLLQERGTALVRELGGGKSLEDVAKSAGLEVKQAWSIKRQGQSQGLSGSAVKQVFASAVKGFGTTLSGNGTERIVFQVLEQIVPAFDAETAQSRSVGRQLGEAVAQDLFSEYVEKVKADVGVTINQVNLDRAVGGAVEN